MEEYPKIKRLGERAILLEFEPEISFEMLKKVLGLKKYIQERCVESIIEVNSTYNSLLISYHTPIENAYGDILSLLEGFSRANISYNLESRLFRIPVCYNEGFGLDLEDISQAKNLSKNEIIDLHSSAEYLVYFIGFLPGFLYLGGLPKPLHFPRKIHPRQSVRKGAVGIGEKQTGIYPQTSPGGWNIIGNSPVPLFDPDENPPCEIRSGDRIRFYPVSEEEHCHLVKEVKTGNFRFKIEEENG